MESAIAKMNELADQMCTCRDRACADHVQEVMTTWAAGIAKDGSKTKNERKPPDEQMKRMTDVTTKYADCMVKAMMPPPEPVELSRNDLPPPISIRDADVLLREARMWAHGRWDQHVIGEILVSYVDAKGRFDESDGELVVVFDRPLRPDDPSRTIGAPVPAKQDHEDCFQMIWKTGVWSSEPHVCSGAHVSVTRCTPTQIWKQAIARKAPANGLARLTWKATSTGGVWGFSVQDQPRGIDVRESFDDDCPLAVEK
jgi:hypothetical protein